MPTRAAIALLFTSFLLPAQPRIVAEVQTLNESVIRQLMASGDPAGQAWAAYFAAASRQTKWTADLIRLMMAPHPDVQLQALDALVQLSVNVPSEDLMRLWPQYRAYVLILLARKPQENKDVLHSLLAQQLSNEEWVAAHNLLISFRDTELARELLQSLEMKLTVTVVDSWNRGVGGGGIGGGVGCGGLGIRPGFPPLMVYRLTDQPELGDAALTGGLHPIYYHRGESSSGPFSSIDRNAYRYHFLAELMGARPMDLAAEPYLSETITWQGPKNYVASVAKFRTAAESRFHLMLWQLQNAKVLTPSQAKDLKMQLKIVPVDARGDMQIPLPDLSAQ